MESALSDSRLKQKDLKRIEAEIRNKFSAQIQTVREICRKSEARIEQLEARQTKIEAQLAEDSFYQDPEKSNATLGEYKAIRQELPELYARWQEADTQLRELEELKNTELEKARMGQIA
jgi:ATP-binding cassette subfamily F protein 3